MLKKINSGVNISTNATYIDKIFRHKLHSVYRICLILILCLVIFLVIKIQIDNRVYTDYEVTSSFEKTSSSSSEYLNYNGNLLVYSKDGISAYNSKGAQIFNQTYEMQNPIVRVNGSYIAIADYKASKIYVLNETGLQGQIETNMMILDLTVSNKGVVGVLLDDSLVNWIYLYTQTGETITTVKASMNQTGFPLAHGVSPDNIKLGVSYLVSQGGNIETNIAFYNFGNVGQNETGNLVSAYPYEGELAPYIAFPKSEVAVVVSDKQMTMYKGKQIPTLSCSVPLEEEVQTIVYNEQRIGLVFLDTSDENNKYRMDLYDFNGKLQKKIPFNVEYEDIIIKDKEIVISNEANLLILNHDGDIKYNGEMNSETFAIISTKNENCFMLVKEDKVEYIKLK